ncbi:MAG: response regulator transcription factor, partial [Actinomycetota bacterium]|nr:response regulator transcription factor [Actinomycetota bacterium]
PRSALERLRSARRIWQDLEVPYEGARACVLIGLACRAIGDDDGAELETTTARRIFRQLGAAPDLARLDARSAKRAPKGAGPLTTREVQVLALVAKGRSNKEIAAELIISDRTVARHMSNIFTKLNVSSRTAATAYAFEHDLV